MNVFNFIISPLLEDIIMLGEGFFLLDILNDFFESKTKDENEMSARYIWLSWKILCPFFVFKSLSQLAFICISCEFFISLLFLALFLRL